LNTRLSYRYTDNTYCKQYTSIVVEGTITWDQIEPFLTKRGFFIPGQVGLEDLQHRFALAGSDHPWHQMVPEDLRPTESAPTVPFNAEELAHRFATTTWTPDVRSASIHASSMVPSAPALPSSGTMSPVLSGTTEERLASRQWIRPEPDKKATARKKR
jgi:hypothetical protein